MELWMGLLLWETKLLCWGMLCKEQRRTFLQATLQQEDEAFFLLVEDDRDVVRWFHCG
jgi:hypothetical protein